MFLLNIDWKTPRGYSSNGAGNSWACLFRPDVDLGMTPEPVGSIVKLARPELCSPIVQQPTRFPVAVFFADSINNEHF